MLPRLVYKLQYTCTLVLYLFICLFTSYVPISFLVGSMYIAKFQLSNKLQSNFIGKFNFTKITYNIQMSKKCQDVVRNKKKQ